MAKTPSKKSAKAPKKAGEGKKKKSRTESYSSVRARPSTRAASPLALRAFSVSRGPPSSH